MHPATPAHNANHTAKYCLLDLLVPTTAVSEIRVLYVYVVFFFVSTSLLIAQLTTLSHPRPDDSDRNNNTDDDCGRDDNARIATVMTMMDDGGGGDDGDNVLSCLYVIVIQQCIAHPAVPRFSLFTLTRLCWFLSRCVANTYHCPPQLGIFLQYYTFCPRPATCHSNIFPVTTSS